MLNNRIYYCIFCPCLILLTSYGCYHILLTPTLNKLKAARRFTHTTHPIKTQKKTQLQPHPQKSPEDILRQEELKHHITLLDLNISNLKTLNIRYQSTFAGTCHLLHMLLTLPNLYCNKLNILASRTKPLLITELICDNKQT